MSVSNFQQDMQNINAIQNSFAGFERQQKQLGVSHCEVTRLFRLWQTTAPREFRLATGELVSALHKNPQGLTKTQLMQTADAQLALRSLSFLASLECAVNKRIQRARRRARDFGLDISYSREDGLWRLQALSSADVPKFA